METNTDFRSSEEASRPKMTNYFDASRPSLETNTEYITYKQAAEYRRLALIAQQLTDGLQSFAVEIVQSNLPDSDKIGALNWLSRGDGLNGIAYALTPQTEWIGGENIKIRRPNINLAVRAS